MGTMDEPPATPMEPFSGSRNLHDATLETVSLDWRAGVAEVRLKSESGTVLLRASAVARLSCPRLYPWGPSSSVNEVRSLRTADGRAALEIEMQSGDVIAIEAASFARET
jgi:hypothetical protein